MELFKSTSLCHHLVTLDLKIQLIAHCRLLHSEPKYMHTHYRIYTFQRTMNLNHTEPGILREWCCTQGSFGDPPCFLKGWSPVFIWRKVRRMPVFRIYGYGLQRRRIFHDVQKKLELSPCCFESSDPHVLQIKVFTLPKVLSARAYIGQP